uniref:Uncharacterized protein n=1 Tax=viral metagenome TaxID=1070528 RepID=A0A6C0HZX8_9ZZZZ
MKKNKNILYILFFIFIIILFTLVYNLYIKKNKESFTNNIEIVIARYNENLNWLNDEPFNDIPVIVYNKGPNENFIKNEHIYKIVPLPNIGREMHTFFYHIIENYENLANVTIFLVGSTDSPWKMEKAKPVVLKIKETNNTTMSCNEDENIMNKIQEFQIDNYMSSNSNNSDINNDENMKKSDIRPYGKWYESTFVNNEKNTCIGYNSVFGISRKHILQKPKSYYENLLNQVNDHQNLETVHYIERSWYAIFYPYDEINIIPCTSCNF